MDPWSLEHLPPSSTIKMSPVPVHTLLVRSQSQVLPTLQGRGRVRHATPILSVNPHLDHFTPHPAKTLTTQTCQKSPSCYVARLALELGVCLAPEAMLFPLHVITAEWRGSHSLWAGGSIPACLHKWFSNLSLDCDPFTRSDCGVHFIFIYLFLARPRSMQDLNFLTRDQTCVPCIRRHSVLATWRPGKSQGCILEKKRK